MAVELVMPRLSDSMSEGTIVSWLVADGVAVERGQEIAEIETDKSTAPFQAPEAGVLRILVPPGTTVPLGEPIALIDDLAPLAEEAGWTGHHTVRASVPPPAAAASGAHPGADADEEITTEFAAIDTEDPWGDQRLEPADTLDVADDVLSEDTDDGPGPPPPPPALPWIDPASTAQQRATGFEPGPVSVPQATPKPEPVPEPEPTPAPEPEPEPELTLAPGQDPAQRFTADELLTVRPPLPPSPPAMKPAGSESGPRIAASPVARRLAGELGLDLAQITGTGPEGRIIRADIDAAVAAGAARPAPLPGASVPSERSPQPPVSAPQPEAEQDAQPEPEPDAEHMHDPDTTPPLPEPTQPEPATPEVPSYSLAAPDAEPAAPKPEVAAGGGGKGAAEPIELTRQQATVARRMAEGRATIPEFQLTLSVDAEPLEGLRDELRHTRPELAPPTVNDLVVKATALALKSFPRLNAAYRDGRIEQYPKVNIGIAVDAGEQLLVPVVHSADELSITQLAERSADVIGRAREGGLRPPDIASATFTTTNLGALGIERFTAIITPGQAGMLTIGAVRSVPVVKDGVVAPGRVMELTLLTDHRVAYGAEAARFLTRIRALLERPAGLLT